MEQIPKGKEVLSDIEQSVQNALALFNAEDFGVLPEPIKTFDDPIVSLHDPKTQEYFKKNQKEYDTTFKNQEVQKISPREPTFFEKMIPKLDFGNFFSAGYRNSPIVNNKALSYESINLPFSSDPVKNSVEQMSKLLNDQEVLFEKQNGPSPEEILNIYSEGLGINLSRNTSPRKDVSYQSNDNDPYKSNPERKDKKHTKTSKQPKLLTDKKTSGIKKDVSKSAVFLDKENRMKDLMNIYGCSNKILKPHSESTIGSKSEISKKTHNKKIKKSDDSSKGSIAAPSKKSKRKSKRNLTKSNIEGLEGDNFNLEKSSRINTKRKSKQKSISGNMKMKNQNLKRKKGSYFSNDNTSFKLNRTSQTLTGQESQNPNKQQPTQAKSHSKTLNLQDSLKLNKSQVKNSFYTNNASISDDIKQTKQELLGESALNRKQSNERQLNKQVLFNEDVETSGHSNINNFDQSMAHTNNQTLTNGDLFNEDFSGQQTFHYTLPTHSSRSKEVERFLNGHYQHLPFVIGQSTNKSHNLWVNIQEALSLIKQKVPQTNDTQSTLHYNVESEKAPSIFSKVSKTSTKKPHQCLAANTDSLYNIPEGMNENEENSDAMNSWENHPECMKANLDPNYSKSRCSCLNQPSVSYKQVLQQIFCGMSENSDMSLDTNNRRDFYSQDHGDSYTAELRKTLISFTQEFEEMNNKFDQMSLDPNASKDELQRLEMQLSDKEEEIRELIARFNEVKELNERVRENGKSRAGYYSLESFKSTTSIRLAQTLRRVQKFKESLKSKPSVAFLTKNNYLQSSY